jgi:hypothetical protein
MVYTFSHLKRRFFIFLWNKYKDCFLYYIVNELTGN